MSHGAGILPSQASRCRRRFPALTRQRRLRADVSLFLRRVVRGWLTHFRRSEQTTKRVRLRQGSGFGQRKFPVLRFGDDGSHEYHQWLKVVEELSNNFGAFRADNHPTFSFPPFNGRKHPQQISHD
jgi:hypothetical protein